MIRAVVVGAGEVAGDLVLSMQRDGAARWLAVALLDDDPRRRSLRLWGVPITGTTADLAHVLEQTGATSVVIAETRGVAGLVDTLVDVARQVGATVDVRVLAAVARHLTDRVDVDDVRGVDLSQYLGRPQLDTDVAAIAEHLAGRRVLVVGAGGSIGSELCRQISRVGPGELMMLDRDESALHAVQLGLHDRALLDGRDAILCDIRDEPALRRVVLDRRPEVVFHAAALKHLPMLEQYPAEAVKTNVWGTRHLLDACEAVGVEGFVNISTDKAADPVSVLGTSKRIGERLTAARAAALCETGARYLSVRFGNVLGSRGSVLSAFARQIAVGGPVTVTHPDVTRYLMTVEEACQLVLQASVIGCPGEALVLDMGEPVRILDVAEQLIRASGETIPVEYTGLRAGEKLHETPFAASEPRDVRPRHPLISHVPVPPLSAAQVAGIPVGEPPEEVRRQLAELCAAAAEPTGARGPGAPVPCQGPPRSRPAEER